MWPQMHDAGLQFQIVNFILRTILPVIEQDPCQETLSIQLHLVQPNEV